MRIGLRELDSLIAQRIRDQIRTLWLMGFEDHQHPHTSDRDKRLAARNAVQKGNSAIAATASRWGASVGLALLTAVTLGLAGAEPGLAFVTFLGLSPGLYGFTWWIHKDARSTEMERSLSQEELTALRQILTLTDSEGLYLDTVSRMIGLGEVLSRDTARQILEELNDLLKQSRELDRRRDSIKAAMSSTLSDLQDKRVDLAKRLESATDQMAQDAIRQSLEMVDERLGDAGALQPGLERVEAQSEVIHQTLASVSAALARMQAAPEGVRTPDLNEILQSVAEVRGQTRAVEEAVQEVMSLTGGISG